VRGELPVNVKVLIEGEEEIGSPNLKPFVTENRKRLACDTIVIADSSQFQADVPAITYGLKGLSYLELIVRGPSVDLHSGSFGGSIANPANVLAEMIAACTKGGRVAIPGFYDDVKPLEAWEREEWAKLDFSEQAYLDGIGARAAFGEPGYTTLERRWGRPTLDVNGLYSGFTGQGAKTVLPAEARAKLSMRLVPDQSSRKITELATRYLRSIAPATVSVEVLDHHGGEPVLVSREGKAMAAAANALEAAFGRAPVFIREGGSIPVVHTFKAELRADSLLLGLGLPDDGAHSPNERFRIRDFHRGAHMMATLLDELAR
jgi:acetylornithine deacetylase/succinyl-diaminopimelate desuccinylase-like protein